MNDKYLPYTVNEFLEDPEFLAEIRAGHLHQAVWESWLKAHPEKEQDYLQAIGLIRSMQFKSDSMNQEREDRLWNRIRTSTASQQSGGKRLIRYLALSGAAAIFFLIIYFAIGLMQHTTITTANSELISHKLPEGSMIELNASSSVSYNKKKWNEDRLIYLQGEAFFDVVKGSPFIVGTLNGQVEVLGTSFNVFNREEVFEVRCKTGRVRVISNWLDTVFLNPGEGVRYEDAGKIKKSYALETERMNQWLEGFFQYEDVALPQIFHEMERQFDIEIILSEKTEIQNMRYTGSFRKGDLTKALKDVCWPMHLTFEIKGRQVRVLHRN